jgi:hypothetical protein
MVHEELYFGVEKPIGRILIPRRFPVLLGGTVVLLDEP